MAAPMTTCPQPYVWRGPNGVQRTYTRRQPHRWITRRAGRPDAYEVCTACGDIA